MDRGLLERRSERPSAASQFGIGGPGERRVRAPRESVRASSMPALFPPWSNTLLKVGASVSLAAFLVAAAAPMVFVRTPYATGQLNQRRQPIQFDHRHHARD